MDQKSWQISRRRFLRGTGAALALPMLDAMAPVASAAAGASSAARPPVRMACLFFPNGMWPAAWVPAKGGKGYELTSDLEPLAKMREEFLVLSGLDKAASHTGDGHYAKDANFLTGTPVTKTTGKNISVGGTSMDQLVAQKFGHLTPLPSLELGIEPVISGIDSNVGYTRLYGSYISWRDPHTPVAREINPRAAYERLFGMGSPAKFTRTPADLKKQEDDRSLLDLVLEDSKELRGQLGRDDQHKMDEYLDAVRSVESRIEFAEKPDVREWRPETTPHGQEPPDPRLPRDHRLHVKLMLDMIILAFWTDTTRVSTFMFGNSVSGRNFTGLIDGVKGGHHELSHHENQPAKIEQYSKIVRWHVEQFGYVLSRLKTIKEGEGNLLDHSLVLLGSGMSDGNRHEPSNLPILLGGRGGGKVKPGRHIASPKNTPLSNLYLSMLHCAGVGGERFGDSSGEMRALFDENAG
jgi:hypothetical protein